MGATLDGVVEATGAVFEAKFMLPWSFSETAAAEKYMPQLQHNMWVTNAKNSVLSIITGGGMFVPGLPVGKGSEVGHKHFQHPDRRNSDYGPKMDRFSFIALDLSLQAIIEDKTLYPRFRQGGETIVFTANDFADPQSSKIVRILFEQAKA
jgi:hypothetical protein